MYHQLHSLTFPCKCLMCYELKKALCPPRQQRCSSTWFCATAVASISACICPHTQREEHGNEISPCSAMKPRTAHQCCKHLCSSVALGMPSIHADEHREAWKHLRENPCFWAGSAPGEQYETNVVSPVVACSEADLPGCSIWLGRIVASSLGWAGASAEAVTSHCASITSQWSFLLVDGSFGGCPCTTVDAMARQSCSSGCLIKADLRMKPSFENILGMAAAATSKTAHTFTREHRD